jgi:tyrosine-protein kinase Etk/Wzc
MQQLQPRRTTTLMRSDRIRKVEFQKYENAIDKTASRENKDYLDFANVIMFLRKHRVQIAKIAIPIILLGATYAFLAPSTYHSNLLIKVEVNDPAQRTSNNNTNIAGIFDLKTAAAAELEMLRSRSVVTRAVESARLYIDATPKYIPVVGQWAAHRTINKSPSTGHKTLLGYVWGAESIQVAKFDVPEKFEKQAFELTLDTPTSFTLHHSKFDDMTGNIGNRNVFKTSDGDITIEISSVDAVPGSKFILKRFSLDDAVENLQKKLVITERGKQSGLISVELEGTDPKLVARILNEIGQQYLGQNLGSKTEEAEKQLAFLEAQLPDIKNAIEQAESKFSLFRNSRGATDLTEDVKAILQQSVQAQVKLIELRQRQDDLRTRYQDENPLVQAVSQQIKTVSTEIASIDAKIKRVPNTEQDIVKLTRDIRTNTELYASLLATAQQLRLVKASTVGSVRLIDKATTPSTPIGPKRLLILLGAITGGLFAGLLYAFIRHLFKQTLDSPEQLAKDSDFNVAAIIPHSEEQINLQRRIMSREFGINLMSNLKPHDSAIESLRTFRATLEFAKQHARNNIVAITGPTASVGKSFVSANLAALIACSGKNVLLIDADLRDGYLHRYLGKKRSFGLSELLAGDIDFSKAIHRGIIPSLDFISTGELKQRPADLLAQENFGNLLQDLSKDYDYVILDTAPVLAGADALVVSRQAGLVFCIARRNVTKTNQISEATKRFRHSGISINGLIFNGAELSETTHGYTYAHHVHEI